MANATRLGTREPSSRHLVSCISWQVLWGSVGCAGLQLQSLGETSGQLQPFQSLWRGGAHALASEPQQQEEDAWCRFTDFNGSDKLNGLQLIDSTADTVDFNNFQHGSNYEGLFVDPSLNFAFCLIEKNGCSEWGTVIAKYVKDNLTIDRPAYGLAQKVFTEEKATRVFNNKDSVRAVFVRDPLERFLSGFLSKCFTRKCSNPFCFMRKGKPAGTPIAFSEAVSWLHRVDITQADGHFKPQAYHCELRHRLKEYNVVGYMQHETLARDATCLMKRAGLDWLNTHGSGATLNGASTTDRFWQGTREKNDHSMETVAFLQKFFTPASAREVMKIFEVDYETFNMPEPDWIEGSTGEFFDKVPSEACETDMIQIRHFQNLKSTMPASMEGREDVSDNIATLARNAGYGLDK